MTLKNVCNLVIFLMRYHKNLYFLGNNSRVSIVGNWAWKLEKGYLANFLAIVFSFIYD